MAHRIAALIGSLRKASFTKRIANAVIALAPSSLVFEQVELGDLPLYNQELDDDKHPPAAWTAFRDRIRGFDGLLFATPEYNRSVPGCLKNAIDVGSRPPGHSVWLGKPGAIVSVSPGQLGAFGANHHLRQMMVFLDVPMLQQPELYISNAAKLLDDAGQPTDDKTRELFTRFGTAFAAWVERTRK